MEQIKMILSKFSPEFREKYVYDPCANAIVHYLLRGDDPYKIIEALFNDRVEANNRIKEAMNKVPQRIIVTTEQMDQLKKQSGL